MYLQRAQMWIKEGHCQIFFDFMQVLRKGLNTNRTPYLNFSYKVYTKNSDVWDRVAVLYFPGNIICIICTIFIISC